MARRRGPYKRRWQVDGAISGVVAAIITYWIFQIPFMRELLRGPEYVGGVVLFAVMGVVFAWLRS